MRTPTFVLYRDSDERSFQWLRLTMDGPFNPPVATMVKKRILAAHDELDRGGLLPFDPVMNDPEHILNVY